ncbi:hypothetical protein [Enterococcus sp. AZ072]|uniref:hypothetical protein n=1 Tax=unclassified Enterococcus TaxID=2608891 RepID=UPI003D2A7484
MHDKERNELVNKISSKIHDEVDKGLSEVSADLHFSNQSNGVTGANGFRFGPDEMSDYISELMNDVANNLIGQIVH